jgi:hypothetical protein
LKHNLKIQKKVLTSKMESLYLDHKKEMQIYRFAEQERSVKTLKSLVKIDDDFDLVDGKI